MWSSPVALGEVVELHLRELRVRDGDHGPVQGPDAGRAQADLLDGADLLAVAAEVADAHRPVGEQGEAADDVLQRRPDRKGEGETTDAETGDERRDRDADDLCRVDPDIGQKDNAQQSEENSHQGGVDPPFFRRFVLVLRKTVGQSIGEN